MVTCIMQSRTNCSSFVDDLVISLRTFVKLNLLKLYSYLDKEIKECHREENYFFIYW